MPRRREVPRREILSDPKSGNMGVTKFTNVLILDGKKPVAERIVYGALDRIEKKVGKAPIEMFTLAIGNIEPVVEVKSRRVDNAGYQVPVEVRPSRRLTLAVRQLREAAKKRSERSTTLRLAGRLLEASEDRGGAMKKRGEMHRMAETNEALSHFRL